MPEQDLFQGITKDHVTQAIARINEEGYPPMRRSTTYDFVHEGVTYPPKYVMSLAGFFRNEHFIHDSLFGGGEDSACFAYLKDLGFTILPKEKTTELKISRQNSEIGDRYTQGGESSEVPPFFTSEDFDHLKKFAGEDFKSGNSDMQFTYTKLKKTYEKMEYWAQEVLKRVFPKGEMSIRKRPTNQANKFQLYQWARLYPTAILAEEKTLTYTLTIATWEGFCVKIDTAGLGDNDPVRKKYFEYRGEFSSSPIVKMLRNEEVLKGDWEQLIAQSSELMKSLEKDYDALLQHLNLSVWSNTEEEFIAIVKLFPIEYLLAFFDGLDNVLTQLNIKQPDERVVFSAKGKRLLFKIGQRYALSALNKKEGIVFEVISTKKIDTTSGKFEGNPVAYLSELETVQELQSNLPDIKQACANELARTNRSGFQSSRNLYFEKAVFDKQYRSKILTGKENMRPSSNALNRILYGPPGTGKTHELNKIKVADFTDTGVKKTKEELLHEALVEYPFWQVLGAVLYTAAKPLSVSELVEHPIVKWRIKPGVKTKPQNLAWTDLQSYADDESTQMDPKYRRSIKFFHKDKDGKWSIAKDKITGVSEIIDQSLIDLTLSRNVKDPIVQAEVTRYNFITFHQKYSYEDFIEGIKPVLRKEAIDAFELDSETPSQLAFELKRGIFFESCLKALALAGYNSFDECYRDTWANRKAKFINAKGFALFIDEINRANVSAVFGELITLIEENKRIGSDEEMWIQLPQSHQYFAVPPNLYLIGSMNTADKSIALIDIALRRRFEFEGRYPDYKTIDNAAASILQHINTYVFDKKGSADYLIGHAYFIQAKPIPIVLKNKVIPLLMEYFMGKISIVEDAFKGSNWTVKYNKETYSWDING